MERPPTSPRDRYERPQITIHGSVAQVTQAFLVGIFIDSNGFQGDLIIGHSSL